MLSCFQEINTMSDALQWALVNQMSVTEDTASFRTGGSVNPRTLMVAGVMFEAKLTLINSSLIQLTLKYIFHFLSLRDGFTCLIR